MKDDKNYYIKWEILDGYYVNILTDIRDLSLDILPRYILSYYNPNDFDMEDAINYLKEQEKSRSIK